MQDPAVRRRRAVLGALLFAALALVTVSFGSGGSSGPLAPLAGPVVEGVGTAAKPVRDVAGWVRETADARGENDELRTEVDRLRRRSTEADAAVTENAGLRDLVGVNRRSRLRRFDPVGGDVIAQSPNRWWDRVIIDRGSSDGVRVDQAVLGAGGRAGLIGRVESTTRGQAVVALLADQGTRVTVRVGQSPTAGVLEPAGVGNPNELIVQYLTREDRVRNGQVVRTAGTDPDTRRFPSLYPPDVPIGRVTRIEGEFTDNQIVFVRPLVDLRALTAVEVLTGGTTRGRSR